MFGKDDDSKNTKQKFLKEIDIQDGDQIFFIRRRNEKDVCKQSAIIMNFDVMELHGVLNIECKKSEKRIIDDINHNNLIAAMEGIKKS